MKHMSPLFYYPWWLFLTVSFDHTVGDRQLLWSLNEAGKRLVATQVIEDYLAALIPSLLFYGLVTLPLILFSQRVSGKVAIITHAMAFLMAFGVLNYSAQTVNWITAAFYSLLLFGGLGLPYLLMSLQRTAMAGLAAFALKPALRKTEEGSI